MRAASSAIKKRTSHDMPRSAARQSRIFNYRGKSTSCAHSALPRACLANAVVNNARTELAASFVQSINISANCFVCLKCFDLRYFEFKPLASGQSLTYKPKSNYQAFFLFVTQCNVEFVLQLQRGLAIPRRILGTCDELLRSIFMLNHHFNNRTLMCIEVKQA